MFRRFIKKLFVPPMVVIAALFMFMEEWLWDHLTTFMAWVARAPVFRWLEKKLAALPPYGAMGIFLVPGVMLLPVKIAALYLMTHGHPAGGLGIIIAAKVVGTAIVARIFTVCRPSLLTIGWFRRLYEWIGRVKTRLYTAIKAMPAWAVAVRLKNRIKSMLPKKGLLTRQWKAIGQVLRRKFSRKT